jgi:hypothetical protein
MKNLFVPFLVGKIRNDDAKAIDSVQLQAIDGQGHWYKRAAGRFQPHFALCADPQFVGEERGKYIGILRNNEIMETGADHALLRDRENGG